MLDNGNSVLAQKSAPAEKPVSLPAQFHHIQSLLQKEFGDTVFTSWIAPLSVRGITAGTLEIAAPTRFMRDWVKAHYADRIKSLWLQNYGTVLRIEIIIGEKPATTITEKANIVPFDRIKAANDIEKNVDPLSSPLDPRFTFENFVVGKPNEMAHAAARRVAESDAISFNPLFLYGGVGLGKTHLMHAIGHAIRARNPKRRVAYMSAEKFMHQFIRALRFKDMMTFKEQFRSVDVLMIDDIQFICDKEATQEEFFHTFNALIAQNKQIVVSADKSPSDLGGLEERLRSRLGGGLVTDIHPMSYELRLGILQSKCTLLKRDIPNDVLEFLAHRIVSNVRELEGALNRLVAHAELMGRDVTVETAQDLLQDLLRASDRRVSIEEIQKKVAEHFNIRISDMHSPRRARPVARPRQVAMYLSKTLTEHSLPEIGRKFGGRDHTTIIHGIRKIEELLERDPALQEDISLLKRAITG